MSTNPPQPPVGQAYTDPVAELDAAKKKQRNILIVGGLLALALIVGAYFFGQSQEQAKYEAGQPAYNEIYKAGAEAGNAKGTAEGTAEGTKEGVATGTEQGKEAGLEEGVEKGVAEGQAEGASAALGGLTSWSTGGVPYIVTFTANDSEQVPVSVNSRTEMQPGVNYKICDSGNGICQASASAASSSNGGATP